MKKILFALVVTLTLGACSSSQKTAGRWDGDRGSDDMRARFEERQKQELDDLRTRLSLSDAQYKKVKKVRTEMDEKRIKMMGNNPRSGKSDSERRTEMETMRKQMDTLRSEEAKQMKSILSDSQYQLYEAYQQEQEQKMRSRRGGGPGGQNRQQRPSQQRN